MTHGFRSSAAGPRRRVPVLVALALVALAGPAAAGADFTLISGASTTVPLPGGGWRVLPAAPGSSSAATRAWLGRMADAALPGIEATETVTVSGRAGPLVTRVAQRVGLAEAAGVIARCIGNPICVAATGVGIYAGAQFADYYRCRSRGGTASVGITGVECDPGGAPQKIDAYTCVLAYNMPPGTASSPGEACRAAMPAIVAAAPKSTSWTLQDGTRCTRTFSYTFLANDNGYAVGQSTTVYPGQCGVGIDTQPYTPYTWPDRTQTDACPTGGIGPDGKCGTGNYVPATEEDVKQKVVAFPPVPGSAAEEHLRDGVQQAVETGGQTVPSKVSTTGPASQTGTPTSTTTTDANGTSTQTTTPKYDYHYDGDTITYDTTETTQTCVNAGSCSSTTTTTQGPKEGEEKDLCALHPEILACQSLGDPPTDQIRKSSQSVDFASEALALPAACPAPVQLPHGQSISYQPLCDGLTQVRPLIIAIGFLIAGGIVVAGLRV